MKKILVIGATSAIAEATAKQFAQKGHALYLFGRDMDRLKVIADDLKVRGAGKIAFGEMDVNAMDRHSDLIQKATDFLKEIDIILIAHGTLPDQKACEGSVEMTQDALQTNLISTISLLTLFASYFELRKSGTIIVISSVAGDRGRQSNYVYGTAKAALSVFLGGLRNRLHSSGVHVMTVKPGFVDTPMTASFKKGLLWAKPDDIARGIIKAIEKKSDVVYLPWFWRVIMGVILSIPEKVFKRLKL